MKQVKVELVLEINDDAPIGMDWIADSVYQQLEGDEQLVEFNVEILE